jgi:hypothetical protein
MYFSTIWASAALPGRMVRPLALGDALGLDFALVEGRRLVTSRTLTFSLVLRILWRWRTMSFVFRIMFLSALSWASVSQSVRACKNFQRLSFPALKLHLQPRRYMPNQPIRYPFFAALNAFSRWSAILYASPDRQRIMSQNG